MLECGEIAQKILLDFDATLFKKNQQINKYKHYSNKATNQNTCKFINVKVAQQIQISKEYQTHKLTIRFVKIFSLFQYLLSVSFVIAIAYSKYKAN